MNKKIKDNLKEELSRIDKGETEISNSINDFTNTIVSLKNQHRKLLSRRVEIEQLLMEDSHLRVSDHALSNYLRRFYPEKYNDFISEINTRRDITKVIKAELIVTVYELKDNKSKIKIDKYNERSK